MIFYVLAGLAAGICAGLYFPVYIPPEPTDTTVATATSA